MARRVLRRGAPPGPSRIGPALHRGAALILLVLALHPGGASAAEAMPSSDALRRRYAGEWIFAGGAAERALIAPAVERSVDGMFFIARGIAYDRLLKNCEVCSRYWIEWVQGRIQVSGPCQLPDVSPEDGGEAHHRTRLGEESELSQRFVGEALVQEFRGEGGTRKVTWTVQPDGDTLRVRFVISSRHLPRDVDYTLTYRRRAAVVPPGGEAGAGDGGTAPARAP